MLKNKNIENFIYKIIILVMILIPLLKLSTYVPIFENFYTNVFEIKRVYVLWVVIFFLVATHLYLIFSKREKISVLNIFVYVLIILAFLSTQYAIDFEKSFFGEEYRYEGLLTVLSYYLLFLNSKSISNDKYIKNIIKVFMAIGIFQSVYALLQSFTDFTFIRRHSLPYMAMGLCSNPNFFGSYMVMQLLMVGYMYVYNPKKIYLFIYILFGVTLYIAESTGPVLSVFVALIFSLFIMHDKIRKIIKLFIILLLSLAFANLSLKYIQNNKFEQELIEEYDISSEISAIPQKTKEEIGNGRLVIWENSIPLVKKYWLIGCGLDNFKDVYPNEGYIKFDKAHNVYLQMSITNGVPALIIFLLLLFIAFIKGIKVKNKDLFPIYMAFIGYSIQAFFNISVIDVAPYYYIILGLIFSENFKKEKCKL